MSFIKRYSLAMVCALIALIGAVVGVLGLTVLAPAQQVQASIETDDPYAMTRQGVLGLYGDSVTVTAEAQSGQTAWIALGTATDVQSWLEDREYIEIIGVKNTLTDLEVEESAQSGGSTTTTDDQTQSQDDDTDTQNEQDDESAEEQVENPISSDMWTLIKYGTSTASVSLEEEDLDLALIFATDGENPAPKITLTWETPTPYYMALSGFLVAIAFAFSSFASFVTVLSIRRRRAESAKKLEILDRAVSTDTTVIPVVENDGPKLLEAPRAKKSGEEIEAGPKTLPDPPVFDDYDGYQPEDVGEERMFDQYSSAQRNGFATGGANSWASGASDARAMRTGTEPVLQSENADNGELEDAQRSAREFVSRFMSPSMPVEPAAGGYGQMAAESEMIEPATGFASPMNADAAEDYDQRISQALEVSEPDNEDNESDRTVETLPTDSAMLNMMALQSGMQIPSRRAMREAEKRGVSALMVGGRKFSMNRKEQNKDSQEEESAQ